MPNRYMCSALDEMREQLKTLSLFNIKRYKAITALMIEEIQTLGNRMEAALRDVGELERLHKKMRNLKKKIKALERKEEELSEKPADDRTRFEKLMDGDEDDE